MNKSKKKELDLKINKLQTDINSKIFGPVYNPYFNDILSDNEVFSYYQNIASKVIKLIDTENFLNKDCFERYEIFFKSSIYQKIALTAFDSSYDINYYINDYLNNPNEIILDFIKKYYSRNLRFFENCTFECFGKVEKITKNGFLFKYIKFIDPIDFDCNEHIEDHIWITNKESIEILKACDVNKNDTIKFFGFVYSYTRKNKTIDFTFLIEDEDSITKVKEYNFPNEIDLAVQEIKQIQCEVCLFNEHCDGLFCINGNKEIIDFQHSNVEEIAKKNDLNYEKTIIKNKSK